MINKKDLVGLIYNKHSLQYKDVLQLVDLIIELVSEAIIYGENIQIRNFGSFSRKKRKAHFNINPYSLKKTYLSDRYICHFSSYIDILA